MIKIDNTETPKKAKKKKYSFKLVSSNYIFGGIVCLIAIFLNFKTSDLDGYLFGTIIGSLFGIIIFPLLMALLFWFILGRKQKGGTITFNIIMTLMLFSQIGQFSRRIQENNKTADAILNAMSEYKETSLEHPDSINVNYTKFSSSLNGNITKLFSNSRGEEKKFYLGLQRYFVVMDIVYKEFSDANIKLDNSKVFDFNYLKTSSDYDGQIAIIDNYILKSQNYKSFFLNRKNILTKELNDINSTATQNYMANFIHKDSIQKVVFEPYINAHIDYGNNLHAILNLLKEEHNNWEYNIKDDTLIFEFNRLEKEYNTIISSAIINEEKINSLNEELYKTL